MSTVPFQDRARVDAFDKVRGATQYAADIQFPGLLFAMTVPSPIAKGTLSGLDTEAAMRVPGVVRILTPDDFPAPPAAEEDGPPPPPPTLVTEIAYRGQPVALVVAATLEAAIEAAKAVRMRFSRLWCWQTRCSSRSRMPSGHREWNASTARSSICAHRQQCRRCETPAMLCGLNWQVNGPGRWNILRRWPVATQDNTVLTFVGWINQRYPRKPSCITSPF
jgi:xanthine dehydrogenase YagR molybdenum-binding subunit